MEQKKARAVKARNPFRIIFPETRAMIHRGEALPGHILLMVNPRGTDTAIRSQREVPASIMLNPLMAIKRVTNPIEVMTDIPVNALSRICYVLRISWA